MEEVENGDDKAQLQLGLATIMVMESNKIIEKFIIGFQKR
jgi:hypothetical protein